jgi:hypothetical protein
MPERLRVYDPAECDAQGVPLDWAGGLKAKVLAHLLNERGRDDHETHVEPVYSDHASLARATCSCDWESDVMDDDDARDAAWTHSEHDPHPAHGVARCEGCGHPMSDGTWTEPADGWGDDLTRAALLAKPYSGERGLHGTAERRGRVHWSPCDEGCRHAGPFRRLDWTGLGEHDEPRIVVTDQGDVQVLVTAELRPEASWRQVDVRTLGWAHDLRPERLAVLCLRCTTSGRISGPDA